MDTETWIALWMLVIAIIALAFSFYRQMKKFDADAQDERIKIWNKIQNNELRLGMFEKDIVEMKKKQESDIKDLRKDFRDAIEQVMKQNREDHHTLFNKLDVYGEKIVKAATLIEEHIKNAK